MSDQWVLALFNRYSTDPGDARIKLLCADHFELQSLERFDELQRFHRKLFGGRRP